MLIQVAAEVRKGHWILFVFSKISFNILFVSLFLKSYKKLYGNPRQGLQKSQCQHK